MMKKLLIAVCVIAISAVSVVGASAESSSLISQYQEAYSQVEYDNPTNFEIVIPETINANEGELKFTANHMNLHTNEVVEVISKNGSYIDLSSETTEDKAKYYFNANSDEALARFENGELTSQISVYPYVENAREIAAAHYTGTATFTIRLTEKT